MTQLSQNFSPTNLTDGVVRDFVRFMERNNYNPGDDLAINRAWSQFRGMVMGSNSFERGVIVGPYSDSGKLYDNGPFSWQDEDLISDVTTAGSALAQWIPTTTTDVQEYVVSHLSWVAPNGWGGSNYSTFLANLEIPECEFGPATKWNSFQYSIPYGEFSFQSNTLKVIPTLTMDREYARTPQFRLRGPYAGSPIDVGNEQDFEVSKVAHVAQNHHAYVLIDGQKSNQPKMEWDGLGVIIANGYVSGKVLSGSSGSFDWANPVVVDGSSLATAGAVIRELRQMIRFIMSRASKRRQSVMQGDIAIFMSATHWQVIAEELAVNGITGRNLDQSVGNVDERLARFMTETGGVFPVDQWNIPVYTDDGFAANSNSNTTSTGDIFVLTRRVGSDVILEQQYADFDKAVRNKPDILEFGSMRTGLGGIMRYGWVMENQTCYHYFCEMAGRLLTRSQPYQGRISSVTLPLSGVYREETAGFWDDYYPQDGTPGTLGAGV